MRNLSKQSVFITCTIIILLLLIGVTWLILIQDKSGTKTESVVVVHQSAKYQTSPEITTEDLHYFISVLASDSLEGRAAGTQGEQKTIDFISEKFADYGLISHLQPFTFLKRGVTWFDCSLSFNTFKGEINRDFVPILMIKSSKVTGEVVFVGYGNDNSKQGTVINDYKDVDVRDKWVMIFEDDFSDNKIMQGNWHVNISERYNAAIKYGAAGLLSIDTNSASNGQLVSGSFPVRFVGAGIIPLIRISGNVADSLFSYIGYNRNEVLRSIRDKRWNIRIPVKVEGFLNARIDSLSSNNIVAYFEGRDSILKKEYIVVGAHYDHIGQITIPLISGDSTVINFGADDNASGTAGVMELAEKLVSTGNLKRSIIFVLFGAEEQGLKGSNYFCENFPVPPDKIKLMINLDMIGRMDSLNNLYIRTDNQNRLLIEKAAALYSDINLDFNPKSFGSSDHQPFASKKIPIAYFTTGSHDEYHTPKDHINTLNFEGEKRLLDLIFDFIILRLNAEK